MLDVSKRKKNGKRTAGKEGTFRGGKKAKKHVPEKMSARGRHARGGVGGNASVRIWGGGGLRNGGVCDYGEGDSSLNMKRA